MRLTLKHLHILLLTLYVAAVTIGFSYLIGAVTQHDLLLSAAFPLGVLLVALLGWLPPRPQLLAWASVTAWLLPAVYLGTSPIEYVMFFTVMLMAVAGVFWSPWFLAAIWYIHPLWDVIPRDLPPLQRDLPLACLIYDLGVAVYLTWRIRKGFFASAAVVPSHPTGLLRTGLSRSLTATAAILILALYTLAVGMVSMDSLSVWLAIPVAAVLVAATRWIPLDGQKIFWLVFTIWTGMTFSHSGNVVEIAVFAGMIALAVLGYLVSPRYWVIAWTFHAVWYFLPRAHLSHGAARVMGHWMMPMAGFLFEIAIALYLLPFGARLPVRRAYVTAPGQG